MEKVHGIVIRTRDYGESNKIVTLFTKEYGLISAVAKGAKKAKSRMAAVSQPFIYGLFLVYLGKGLGTIQQGEVLESMRGVREDIIQTAYASFMCELVTKIMEEKEPNLALFNELYLSLERMVGGESPSAIAMMFELKMYHVGGFAPITSKCVNGHEDIPIVAFSVSEGGVICEQCKHRALDSTNLTPQQYNLLRLMNETSIKRVRNISINQENLVFLRQILDDYYDNFGGLPLKSKKFLKQIHLFDSNSDE
ncbi:DNA repair protein RecO [Halalkalibacillus sediminis]|uniref:DNA repair protein RecO n=1 Tax=Halalkalibacillus sediminis TaxID=2018042 RepID=A0A2I0QXF3_9BACI|nr:DNA repair protein RecO [Halalkalibacillus sediminis]PKR79021.1 DNA repair protein RecO [Halalkalibacillus sediminis]